MNFARSLQVARLRAGHSQQSLADHMGLQRPSISQIESGARHTTTEKVDAWVAACAHEVLIVPRFALGTVELADLDDQAAQVLAAVRAALPLMTARERAVLLMEAELVLREQQQPKK
jgi:transcriptional regulator with XRE-family HTH domain